MVKQLLDHKRLLPLLAAPLAVALGYYLILYRTLGEELKTTTTEYHRLEAIVSRSSIEPMSLRLRELQAEIRQLEAQKQLQGESEQFTVTDSPSGHSRGRSVSPAKAVAEVLHILEQHGLACLGSQTQTPVQVRQLNTPQPELQHFDAASDKQLCQVVVVDLHGTFPQMHAAIDNISQLPTAVFVNSLSMEDVDVASPLRKWKMTLVY